MALALLALLVPTLSEAGTGPLQLYDASVGQGNTLQLFGSQTDFVLNIDFDASNSEGGSIQGLSASFMSTGNITLSGFVCDITGGCTTQGIQGGTSISLGSSAGNSDLTGIQDFFSINITGNDGTFELLGGNYLTGGSIEGTLQPFTIAVVDPVPEPGTLVLLGAGLLGVAFLRKRSA